MLEPAIKRQASKIFVSSRARRHLVDVSFCLVLLEMYSMLGNKPFVAVLLALLVLIALPCHAKDPDWIEVHSQHFSVFSDAGDRRARDVALRFEQMYFVFGTLFSKQTVNFPVPLQIIAFRNTAELRNFVPLWKGKPIQIAGLYQGGQDRNFILLDLSVEDPYQVVFHEYAHLLLNGNYPSTQVWFDEGFAQYYSTIQVKAKGNQVQMGLAPPGAFETLRGSSLFHTIDLFSVRHDSKVYNENGDYRSLFYDQSWLYVHYLFDTKKMDQAAKYFSLTQSQQVPMAQALQQAFGMDAAQFDREIQDYLKGDRMYGYTIDLPEMETMIFTSEKLRPLDSQAILADVHLHSPDYLEKSVGEFEQILSADPENAAAHRGLGYAYLMQNQLSKAGPHLERAAALTPNDPRVHFYSAYLMREQAEASGNEENWPGMLGHLRTAIRLDPQFPDAYDLLASVQIEQGANDEALESSKAALRLSPRNLRFQTVFGQCLMATGKWDDAEALFQRLKLSDDPEISADASKNLELIEQYKTHGTPAHMVRNYPVYKEKEWGTNGAQVTQAGLKTTETPAGNSAQKPGPVKPVPVKIDKRPIRFLKGMLINVDCAKDSSALLNVAVRSSTGQKVWSMSIADRDKLVLVGADSFSCQWNGQKVAVNYREASSDKGDLVSLEIQ
jgi:tetratricopeptide (TPR) repeat protein